ncbi:MAG: hypothetical protein Q8L82_03805 [Nitrosomonas sp.]|nr:hypothetical protein [Nitrosomonas sp.]
MVTKRGKQASRKAAVRKYGFLEVPISQLDWRGPWIGQGLKVYWRN